VLQVPQPIPTGHLLLLELQAARALVVYLSLYLNYYLAFYLLLRQKCCITTNDGDVRLETRQHSRNMCRVVGCAKHFFMLDSCLHFSVPVPPIPGRWTPYKQDPPQGSSLPVPLKAGPKLSRTPDIERARHSGWKQAPQDEIYLAKLSDVIVTKISGTVHRIIDKKFETHLRQRGRADHSVLSQADTKADEPPNDSPKINAVAKVDGAPKKNCGKK
jgi:hypothetical protein